MSSFSEAATHTYFADLTTAEKTPIIELNSSLPLSDIRDEQQTSGSGSITDNESEFKLNHSTAGDFVRLSSRSRSRYQPGTVGQMGIGVRFGSTPPTNGDYTARWGLFDMKHNSGSNTENVKNGLLFGVDKDGQFVEIIRDGTQEIKTYAKNWNEQFSPNIDLTQGHIFQIDYAWYGYGPVKFGYLANLAGGAISQISSLHQFTPSQKTTIQETNLQVGALVKSSSGTGNIDLFLGGRQFNVVGKFRPRKRTTTEPVTGVSVGTSGFTPLLSFKKKSNSREIPVDYDGFSLLTDNDLLVRVIRGPSLTNASFGSLTEIADSETALEVDTSATAASNGIKTDGRLVSGGSKNKASNNAFSSREIPVDLGDEQIVTIEASAIDSSATVDCIGRMSEQW